MKKIILGFCALALIIVAASFGYGYLAQEKNTPDSDVASQNTENVQEEERQAAPDFTVFNAEGNPVSLSDFKGKPVIANFWATWCGPCKQEMPAFEAAYEKFGEDIVFLMVNLPDGETIESVMAFAAENGFDLPIYFDSEYSASVTYGIRSIPATLFVDSEGYILAGFTGAMSESDLMYYISVLR